VKWLKKLRLINWHYFPDETLHFGTQTILTGMTGAGKSTIIDALQVLLVANKHQIRFNSAAHEDAKRSLINYLRGKIGSQERAHVRENEFTSYIIAEFRDDKQRESFVVGVVLDVHRDDAIHDEYFIIDKCRLEDLTLKGPSGHWCTREEFRRKHNSRKSIFERTKSSYQNALCHRLGQLESRFFSVFCRALSFKPLDDIRDFVYSFILDKRELQLGLLKENFELHERYQRDLRDLEERRTHLTKIAARYDNYTQLRDTIKQQEYVIRSLKALERQDDILHTKDSIKREQTAYDEVQALLDLTRQGRDEAERNYLEARQKRDSHGTLHLQRQLKRDMEAEEATLARQQATLRTLCDTVRREHSLITELLAHPGTAAWRWEVGDIEPLQAIAACLANLPHQSTADSATKLRSAGEQLADLYSRMVGQQALLQRSIDDLEKKAQQLRTEIENLRKKQRPYSEQLRTLKAILTERLGARSPVWVLCEELEIRDEAWRDAIEGYLNTQRFDLLVEPHAFAEALSIYEREKRTYNLDGVGLVDTEKEQKHLGSAGTGSLAELLDTQNAVARARIHHVLGRVMCAADEQDLRRHTHAVTKTCMSYSNLVARQIPRERFEVPYIGAQAIVRQLEQKGRSLDLVEAELSALGTALKWLTTTSAKLSEKRARYEAMAEQLHLPTTIAELESSVEALASQLAALDVTELKALEAEVDYWLRQKSELGSTYDKLTERKATLGTKLNSLTGELRNREFALRQAELAIEQWVGEHPADLASLAKERLAEALKTPGTFAARIVNWENNQKGNVTRRDNEFQALRDARHTYNLRYTFNGDHAAEDNDTYQQILSRIGGIDIPAYQSKLADAQRQAEDQFKSHFMHKMREAILEARREFDRINSALHNFPFSDDRYRFEVRASDKYRQFYDCIMDDALAERDSLFALPDDERATALQNLFEQLIRGDADTQEEFTDYRRYLDFDIIVTSQGAQYKFSKVLREKSGGETQTPFYIIILAAFNQLYTNGKTMRLVVFDEAFNKMDEQRIRTSLRLIKKLNLQLIAAVPDEKLQHMAPEVTTTLLVGRTQYTCFVDMLAQEEVAVANDDRAAELQVHHTLFPVE